MNEEDVEREGLEGEDGQDYNEAGEADIGQADGLEQEVDPEVAAVKAKVQKMEEEAAEEAAKISSLQQKIKEQHHAAPAGLVTQESKEEADSRSIHVANCDYNAKPEELQTFFSACGPINRVTICCDKYTGNPLGYAYVEFTEADSVEHAKALNETLFRGRQITVTNKRTNLPGITRGRGGGSFRGQRRPFRSGSRFRGGRGRGRARGFGNRTAHFSPY